MFGSVVIDVILLAMLVGYTVYGLTIGFAQSLGGIVGAVLGAIAAFFAIPLVTGWVGASSWRLPAVLLVVVVLVGLGQVVGSTVGRTIRRGVARGPLRAVDRFFGAVLSLLATAVVISMLAFGISSLGVPWLSQAIGSSRVVSAIDALTPPPLKGVEAQIRSIVTEQGIPRLLDIGDQSGPVQLPTSGASTAAQQAAAHSVMKITGNAYQCGQNQSGSGVVIAAGRVLTNAHVVAGVDQPVVSAPDGGAWPGRVVYFDPENDLAVIAVGSLPAKPLAVGPVLAEGASGVFDGYPLGGPFSEGPAKVLGVSTAQLPDIYEQNQSTRQIYSLAANVQEGNSGGPLLDASGRVAGIVFAKSATTANLGFAMTPQELSPVVAQAPRLSTTVSSGHCTQG